MRSVEEKLKNMASTAKKQVKAFKAKFDEKVEKATARTSEEKQMARERRKAKEAQAEMELHQAKARHAAKTLAGKQAQNYGYVHKAPANYGAYYGTTLPVTGNQGHQAVGAADTMTGTAIPTYPLGGYPTGRKY